MSETNRINDHGSFDPGGRPKRRSSPSFEPAAERLQAATHLHKNQKLGSDGRIITVDLEKFCPDSSVDKAFISYKVGDPKQSKQSKHSVKEMERSKELPHQSDSKSVRSADSGMGSLYSTDNSDLPSIYSSDSGLGTSIHSKYELTGSEPQKLNKMYPVESSTARKCSDDSLKPNVSSVDSMLSDFQISDTSTQRSTNLSDYPNVESDLSLELIIPRTEHSLDKVLEETSVLLSDSGSSRHLELPFQTNNDGGSLSSVQSTDFSSIESSFTSDYNNVTYRDKSKSNISQRPYSENPYYTSRDRQSTSKAESWHADTPRNKLRDYAIKMNYTEAEFDQCMQELKDDDVDSDTLLKHLCRVRERNQTKPQSSTTKKGKQTKAGKPEGDSNGLRRIVIDGSNVAMEHGLHQVYSCRGIEIAVRYFQDRGHEYITVFVPAHRMRSEHRETKEGHILADLCRAGVVVKTPSRKSLRGNIASYEDRFILKLASMDEAIVVSNDHFRDLKGESSAYRETIEKRILPFVFVNDQFIPAEDPLGKRGPTLEQFLRIDPFNTTSGTCPYGRKCTYGTKCKYGHPERVESYDSALGDSVKNSYSSSYSSGYSSSNIGDREFSGSAVPNDYWMHHSGRSMPFDQYGMSSGAPAAQYLSSGLYQYNMPPRPAPRQSVLHHPPYYQPVDSVHLRLRSPGLAAEHPQPRVSYTPPPFAHFTNNKSYHSVPLEDVQYKRTVMTPSPLINDGLSSRAAASVETDDSYSNYDVISSSAPQPLDENISSTPSQYPTRLAEGRIPPTHVRLQQPVHPLEQPILESDPRYKLYYHLKNLFNERIVLRVMNKNPLEMDPNKLTADVLMLQRQTAAKSRHDC